jgi:hypothetical protein
MASPRMGNERRFDIFASFHVVSSAHYYQASSFSRALSTRAPNNAVSRLSRQRSSEGPALTV